VSDVT